MVVRFVCVSCCLGCVCVLCGVLMAFYLGLCVVCVVLGFVLSFCCTYLRRVRVFFYCCLWICVFVCGLLSMCALFCYVFVCFRLVVGLVF